MSLADQLRGDDGEKFGEVGLYDGDVYNILARVFWLLVGQNGLTGEYLGLVAFGLWPGLVGLQFGDEGEYTGEVGDKPDPGEVFEVPPENCGEEGE